MSEFSKEQVLDIDFETARALHRVVRGMHDGECPSCHGLVESHNMRQPRRADDQQVGNFDLKCPGCGFTITAKEQDAAIRAFGPVMEKNLAIFQEWRRQFHEYEVTIPVSLR
jgi:hypothetical protein